jgi:hypothetical protein
MTSLTMDLRNRDGFRDIDRPKTVDYNLERRLEAERPDAPLQMLVVRVVREQTTILGNRFGAAGKRRRSAFARCPRKMLRKFVRRVLELRLTCEIAYELSLQREPFSIPGSERLEQSLKFPDDDFALACHQNEFCHRARRVLPNGDEVMQHGCLPMLRGPGRKMV